MCCHFVLKPLYGSVLHLLREKKAVFLSHYFNDVFLFLSNIFFVFVSIFPLFFMVIFHPCFSLLLFFLNYRDTSREKTVNL